MKTVIFLGAGASKADDAPLQNELFSSYFASRKDQNYCAKFPYKADENIEKIIGNFFECFFNIQEDQYPSFEEALGILELDENRLFKNLEYSTEKYKHALIIVLEESIQYCLDFKKRSNPHPNNHLLLVNELSHRDLNKDVTFISTNYDLLVDNTLYYRGLDYGFNETIAEDRWKLFKLHGSLNWLYCTNCNKIDKIDANKMALDTYFKPSKISCNCGRKRETVIIPPTYFKKFENPVLKNIWNHARESLVQAEHIIFCGYSFPDADIHIKYLLKSAEIDPSAKLQKVTLVNHHGELANRYDDYYKTLKEQELSKYRLFYKCEVIDSGKSFEEFVKNTEDND